MPGISQECVRTLVEAHGTPESNTGGPSLDRKPSQPQTGITVHVVSGLLGNALSQTAQMKKAAQFWALDATSHSPGGVRHERGSQTHGGAPLPTRRHRRPVRVMVNPRKKRLHSAMGSPASSCVALSLWAQVRAAGEEDGGGTALGEVCVGSRQWPRPGSAHALGSVSPVSTEQTVLRGGRERRHKRAGEGAQGWGWGCLSPPACSFLYSSGSSGPLRSWLGRGSCLWSHLFPLYLTLPASASRLTFTNATSSRPHNGRVRSRCLCPLERLENRGSEKLDRVSKTALPGKSRAGV